MASRMLRCLPLLALVAPVLVVATVQAEVPPRWSGAPNDLDPADDGWDLLSGLPPGADKVRADERELGSGNWADRAWEQAKGRWDVRIAVLDSGIKWDERDLLYTAWLNPGELGGVLAPRVDRATPVTGAVIFAGATTECAQWPGGAVSTQDVNGDGVFNLADYWCDARMRPDAGVAAAAHVFDPGDLIALLSDGKDGDGNGYVDDISGWDVMMSDNDPYDDTRFGHGTGEAKDSAGEGNNGDRNIGVCPGCSHIPVRVGDSFITDVHSFADGVAYAMAVSAKVVQEALGTLNMNARAQTAIDAAYAAGIVVIGSAADEASYHHNWPGSAERVVYTKALMFDNPDGPVQSTTYLNFSNCTNWGIRVDVSHPSTGCSSGATGRTSGAAGLIASAARDAGIELSAEELAQLLRTTADDVATTLDPTRHPTRLGWDARTGYGRVNVYQAVRAIAAGRIPPEAEIIAPAWFTVVDPRVTQRLAVTLRLAAVRSASYTWLLEAAAGGEVADEDFVPVANGSGSGAGEMVQVKVDFKRLAARTPPARDSEQWRHARTLRLTVRDAEGNVAQARKVVFVQRDPTVKPGFPRRLDGSLETSPKLADLDGDGRPEIVQATAQGSVYALRGDGRDLTGFPVRLPTRFHGPTSGPLAGGSGSMVGTPAVADLDGDGRPEIVVADLEGFVSVFTADGAMRPGWPRTLLRQQLPPARPDRRVEDGFFASPVLHDISGDGRLDIVVPGLDGRLYAYDADGVLLAGFPVGLSDPTTGGLQERVVATPAIGDIDGDGSPEIVVGSNEIVATVAGDVPTVTVRVYAVTARGAIAPGWPVALAAAGADVLPFIGRGYPNGVVLADWAPERPGLEVLVTPLTGIPEILDGSGRRVRRLRTGPFGSASVGHDTPLLVPIAQPSAADLDGDGVPDPIMPLSGAGFAFGAILPGQRIDNQHYVGMWSGATGAFLPGAPAVIDDWQFFANPAVADIDGDGVPEVISGSGGYRVHAMRAEGGQAAGWPRWAHGWVVATPAIGDLDGDGRLDVVVGTREGWLTAWDTEGPTRTRSGANPLLWPEYHRGGHNNASLAAPVAKYASVPAGGGCTAAPVARDHGAAAAGFWILVYLVAAVSRRRRQRRCGKRCATWSTLALLIVLGGCTRPIPVRPEIKTLHDQMYVFDLHVDSPMVAHVMGYDFGLRHPAPRGFMPWRLHVDLPRLVEGGVDGLLFGLVVSPANDDPIASVELQLDYIHREILARYPDRITLATRVDDFERAAREGRIAVWMSLEGAHELGGRLDVLERWHRRGVRSVTLAHFSSNEFASSSADKNPARPGLSAAGRRLVCEANRLGWALDLAHTHPTSFFEALALTQAPVIVSHTGVDGVESVFRNLSDDQIRAVGANGGVIGVIFAGFWLDHSNWSSLGTLIDHMDVVRDLAGIEALAIGSDFDGFIWTPRHLRDVADLPVLTQALWDRGYRRDDLEKLWGKNVLRVLHKVEAVAARMQAAGVDCGVAVAGTAG